MYAFIKGSLAYSSPTSVILDAGGIGYKLFIPVSLFARLPQIGSTLLLHTSFIVRELSQALYGFFTSQERDLFEALMGVTGIGPKIALSVIGCLSAQELHHAILNEDISSLCKVPGIGKKGAERLIIEMRDKISSLLHLDPNDLAIHMPGDPRAQKINDAMSALINLGYNQMTAQRAIKSILKDVPESIELADLITHALKRV